MIPSAFARLLAAFIFLTLALPQASAQDMRKVALVVGNSAYQNVPALPNPVRDAAAVTKLLQDLGFGTVRVHRDIGIRDLRRALGEFADLARDSDVAVFYFAGHGLEVSGKNFLIPTDAELIREFDVDGEAVSLDRVLAALAPAKQLRLAILDACRNNPFLATMRPTLGTRSLSRGLARIEPETADTLVAFAAKAGSLALDGDGELSPFTKALIEHLPKPGLDIRIALGQVRDDVLDATGNQQEPFVYGSLGGRTVSLAPTPDLMAPGSPQLVRELQTELRRVGCYGGAADGKWSAQSREALERFNAKLGLDLPVDVAMVDSLDVVRNNADRVCPLQCPAGYRPHELRCIVDRPTSSVPEPLPQAAPPTPTVAPRPNTTDIRPPRPSRSTASIERRPPRNLRTAPRSITRNAPSGIYLRTPPAPGTLRRGQVVLVDDGRCPRGHVRRIVGGGNVGGSGPPRQSECIARPR